MTWTGISVQCCTSSKWVHLRCSLLSFSRFNTLVSSHSWSCLPCRIHTSSGGPTPTNTVFSSLTSSSLYTSTVQPGPSGFLCQCSVPSPPSSSNYLPFFRPLCISCFCTLPTPHDSGCFSVPPDPSSSPDSLRDLQWNAGGLRARCAELLHFISLHPVNLIWIHESNLNLSYSFWIPRLSALQSHCAHSWYGILSPNNPHASGGVIIFCLAGPIRL